MNQKIIKTGSLSQSKTKIFREIVKKIVKDFAAGGFATLTKQCLYKYTNNFIWIRINTQCWYSKWIMNCYF